MVWNEYNGFCTEETCSGDPHDYFLLAIDESTRNITRSAKDFGYSLAANSPIDDQTAQVPTSLAWSVPINFARGRHFYVGTASSATPEDHMSWAGEMLANQTGHFTAAYNKDEKIEKKFAIALFVIIAVVTLLVCCFFIIGRKKVAAISYPKPRCPSCKFWQRSAVRYEPIGPGQPQRRTEVELPQSSHRTPHSYQAV